MSLPALAEITAIAAEAGALALGLFREVTAELKADRTVVTRADREVEALIADRLGRLLPDAAVLGEEGARRAGRGALAIVIDPIDGTASFVAGLPTWCVCIGILEGDRPVAGVVHVPCAGETYAAADGRAWWNGRPLPRLDAEGAGAGDPFLLVHAKTHLRHGVSYPWKTRSLGSTAYHIALVARGAADGALLGKAHLWDLAGPAAILTAVGGALEHLGGGPVDLGALRDGERTDDYVLAAGVARLPALRRHVALPP